MDVEVWLDNVETVLKLEGFQKDVRQARKRGQVWGLVRQEPDDMQIHVRGFVDGRLEAEHELSNRYVQHLWSHRRSAHVEVMEILEGHGLPTERVSETFVPRTGSKEGKRMPESRTKNWHAMTIGVALASAAVAGRFAWGLLRRR